MDNPNTKRPLFSASDRAAVPEASFSHPLNARSEIRGVSLGDATGLERLGVHLFRVGPGKESFPYHRHLGEEEFVYILSGRGVAEIDGRDYEVGPGDFMGFRTPSVAHALRNPFDEDLVYLSAGERRDIEIAQFPKLGKTMMRHGFRVSIVEDSACAGFPGLDRITSEEK